MPNIPFIQHNRSDGLVHHRRTNKTFESEDTTAKKQRISRRYDRRKHKERRKKQIKVLLDRRQQGLHRRRNTPATNDTARDDTIDATNISVTIGKNINTTA